jgi:hypothetical protein
MPRFATYSVRLAPTAITAGKSLIQIKSGAASTLEILFARIFQVTKTTSEMLEVNVLRKTAAATVTSYTPLKADANDPASGAAGGTAATGINASAEGTDGDILEDGMWNVLNGEWTYLPVPEDRIWVPAAGIVALKLVTSPAASMTIGAIVRYAEYL